MSDLEFRPIGDSFLRCVLQIGGDTYSSGVLGGQPWEDAERHDVETAARAAFEVLQSMPQSDLFREVALRMPGDADPALVARCELVSVSAFWRSADHSLAISLAYGFDDGAYLIASMVGGAIAAVSLAE